MTIILFTFFLLAIIALVIWVNKLKKSLKEHFLVERELQYEVGHDCVTGLVNASMTFDRLTQAIKNAKRYSNKIAILYLEVEYFKQLNNTSGFDISNELLEFVGQKLLENTSENDTVARVDGSEFVIILDNLDNISTIQSLIDKIMEISKETLKIQHHQIQVIFNLGISIYPNDNEDAYNLLSHAYTAMKMTRANGMNGYKYYTADLAEEAFNNEKLEYELVDSLHNNQMVLFYQPQIDTKSKKIIGMEALVRWKHPTMGYILLEEFIHLSEEIGFIIDIDRWVLQVAIAQYQEWYKAGLHPGKLFINLSKLSLTQNNFINDMKKIIQEDPFIKEYLCFEITEAQMMHYPEALKENLSELHALGIKVILDNFGTDSFSLSYLKKLPIDTLKIDRVFIQELQNNKEILKTMIAIAKNMDIDIAAEGIETQEQSDFLFENGCFRAQGFLYHKPEAATEIEEKLRYSS